MVLCTWSMETDSGDLREVCDDLEMKRFKMCCLGDIIFFFDSYGLFSLLPAFV
jgi:hypothetical protein